MKTKALLTFLFLAGLSTMLPAQITLTADDFPAIGDVLITKSDTVNTNVNVGVPGPDQVWDFSQLTPQSFLPQSFVDPASTPSADAFPDATIAISTQGTFSYAKVLPTKAESLGFSLDLDGTGVYTAFPFQNPGTIAVFPLTYGTTFQDTFSFDVTLVGDPQQGLDSIRVKQIATVEAEVDAYGTVITPNGSFEALRLVDSTTTVDSIWAYSSFLGWFLVQSGVTPSKDIQWFARESKGPLVTLGFDTDGNITSVDYTDVFPLPVPDFEFNETTNGTFAFTDKSLNNPTSWLWDFGDGNTSTEQNPTHTYAVPGDYEVCLTVTNNAGSLTTCQTISVVLIPVADFDFEMDGFGGVMFTDMSTNNPTGWLWDFGDGNTSTEQNPTHVYAAPGNVTVCLTASNSAGDNMTCKDLVISSTLEAEGVLNWSVFPNPAADVVRIQFENLYGKSFELVVTNALGQEVFRADLVPNQVLDVRTWSEGFYNYRVLRQDGAVLKADKLLIVR
ncbi:MAG: PKD domain-containing protein [Bacteroidetes bacterium]|nr:MAG: PKD domain-containing protein [Bacteroidota bacterium]